MATRRRVLKYRTESQGELMKRLLKVTRLLKEKPKVNLERERFFAVLVSDLRKAKMPAKEKDDVIKEFVRMRKEIEDEERGITKKPALSGETEEFEKHAVRPVPKQNRGFLRENVSNNIRRYKEELKILKKHK
jgi:hypothetical protein